jgi:DNA-binding CsgD family transcriptional regulator
MVGREPLLADLRTDLDAALAGAGRLVVVSGPAGIGKTSLAQQLTAAASERGVPVSRSRCLDDEGAPPLWPWTQLLERLPDQPTAAHSGWAATTSGSGADSAAARFLRIDRLVTTLISACDPAGRVVVLEDLHWADEASLLALRHLAGELEPARLLVVVAVRSPWPDAVATCLDDALRHPGSRLVDLPPLDEQAVGTYLRATITAPVDAALVAQVHRRTGGSPLLMTAAARALAGLSSSGNPGSSGGPGSSAEVWSRIATATDVSRLATAMLLALASPARATLQLAAVLSEQVDPELLSGITGLDPDVVGAQLQAAAGAGLLTATGDDDGLRDGYRFAHALVRDAIVAALDPGSRRELHRRAGHWLAARAAVDPARAAASAGHLLRSGSAVAVLADLAAAATLAARDADRRLGYADAARWWAVAVDATQRSGGDDTTVCALLTELAAAYYRGSRYTDSLDTCERAAALARELGRGDLLAEVAVVIEGLSMPDALGAIGPWCEQALTLLERDAAAGSTVDDALMARLLAQHAWALAERGTMADAEAASSRAIDLATRTGDAAALLAAVHARSAFSWGADDIPEQLELGRIAIREGTAAGRPLSVALGHSWRCDAAHSLGNLEAGLAEIEAVGRLARSTRLPLIRWRHLRMQAAREGMEGRFDEGLAHSQQAFELMAASGDMSTAGLSGAYLQFVAMITGRPELIASRDFDALFAAAAPIPIMTAAGAVIRLIRGETDEAAALYAAVRPLLFDPPRDTRWIGTVTYLLELAEAFDDAEAARLVLDQLEPFAGLPGALGVCTVIFRGALARDLGRMAATTGDLPRAETLLREAVEMNVRMGARPFVVASRLELASVLERAGGADDEILELARRAANEGRRLSMPGRVRIADELSARRERAARLAVARTDPLTAREHEIAALVAQALTNREIARALVLSERTVESHVRSILAKLGFTGRTEIATWAFSSGATRPADAAGNGRNAAQ